MTLAIKGGRPIVREPIRRRNTLSELSSETARKFFRQSSGWDLSGYLAGSQRGGSAVQMLEARWEAQFGVQHAIAVNSCTSALFAACHVLMDKSPRTFNFFVPVMGMSAAAAVPKLCGGVLRFRDIGPHFVIDEDVIIGAQPGDVVIAINLFGQPAALRALREYCDSRLATLIEDNAQSLFAKEYGVFAGTVGHIGCWSFNVHKPLNTGEGGIVTTNDDTIAAAIRSFINHGEVNSRRPGLNLRMTEFGAVLALAQLPFAEEIVNQCSVIASELWNAALDTKAFAMPEERKDCTHAWHCFPMLTINKAHQDIAAAWLRAEGIPCRAGYTMINKLPAFEWHAAAFGDNVFPNAEDYNERMVLIELGSLDPTEDQMKQMTEAIVTVGRELEKM